MSNPMLKATRKSQRISRRIGEEKEDEKATVGAGSRRNSGATANQYIAIRKGITVEGCIFLDWEKCKHFLVPAATACPNNSIEYETFSTITAAERYLNSDGDEDECEDDDQEEEEAVDREEIETKKMPAANFLERLNDRRKRKRTEVEMPNVKKSRPVLGFLSTSKNRKSNSIDSPATLRKSQRMTKYSAKKKSALFLDLTQPPRPEGAGDTSGGQGGPDIDTSKNRKSNSIDSPATSRKPQRMTKYSAKKKSSLFLDLTQPPRPEAAGDTSGGQGGPDIDTSKNRKSNSIDSPAASRKSQRMTKYSAKKKSSLFLDLPQPPRPEAAGDTSGGQGGPDIDQGGTRIYYTWIEHYKKLQEYKLQHGHCKIPMRNKKLSSWCSRQRLLASKDELPPDRKQLLDEMGFRWTLPKDEREKRKRQMEILSEERANRKRQKAEREGPDIDQSGTKDEERRTYYKWIDFYKELQEYKLQHGHCNIPYQQDRNKRLSSWCARQRHLSGKDQLPPDRKQLLDEMGFSWTRSALSEEEREQRKRQREILSEERANRKRQEAEDPDIDQSGTKDEERRTHYKWIDFYKELQEYKLQHGHCNIPYQQDRNKKLSSWCARQRHLSVKDQLPPDRKQLLDEMGFRWTRSTLSEEEQEQRKRQREKLSEERANLKRQRAEERRGAKLLTNLSGFKSQRTKYQKGLDEAIQFYDINKHWNVPSENVELVQWIERQRNAYKIMKEGKRKVPSPSMVTDEVIQRLVKANFDFQYASFSERIEQYRLYRKNHSSKDGSPPFSWKDVDEDTHPGLAAWIKESQKKCALGSKTGSRVTIDQYRKLQDERIVVDEEDEKDFRTFYGRLLALKNEHGSCRVSRSAAKSEDERILQVWNFKQRERYKKFKNNEFTKMTMAQLQQLVEIGFDFHLAEKKKVTWDDRFEELKAFVQEHGHMIVPPKSHGPLNAWISTNRSRYRAIRQGNDKAKKILNEDRIRRLEEIGIDWDKGSHLAHPKRKRSWDSYFDEFCEFKRRCGHPTVPLDHDTLGYWVRSQRHAFRKMKRGEKSSLTADRMMKLMETGFNFNATSHRGKGKAARMQEVHPEQQDHQEHGFDVWDEARNDLYE